MTVDGDATTLRSGACVDSMAVKCGVLRVHHLQAPREPPHAGLLRPHGHPVFLGEDLNSGCGELTEDPTLARA